MPLLIEKLQIAIGARGILQVSTTNASDILQSK
jgi:hypothetical protein